VKHRFSRQLPTPHAPLAYRLCSAEFTAQIGNNGGQPSPLMLSRVFSGIMFQLQLNAQDAY
jgi:hypothetical protein